MRAWLIDMPYVMLRLSVPPYQCQVFGHGFLTKDGLKMGKSLGNTLDPAALVGAYGPDAVRLFFMKEVRSGGGAYRRCQFRWGL
jgi:methionyl-tRNA synthetase